MVDVVDALPVVMVGAVVVSAHAGHGEQQQQSEAARGWARKVCWVRRGSGLGSVYSLGCRQPGFSMGFSVCDDPD